MADIQLGQGSKELWTISRHFVDLPSTQGLACKLLDGAMPGGGLGFISSSYHPGGVPDPKQLAWISMAEWCRRKPREANVQNLLKVLQETCPPAAVALTTIFPGLEQEMTETDFGQEDRNNVVTPQRVQPVQRHLEDPWRDVIIPLKINFLNPIDIARLCQAKGLISSEDFDDLRTRAADSDAERNDRLMAMLYGTEGEGYNVFKEILREFRSPHRHAALLKRIEAHERKVMAQT